MNNWIKWLQEQETKLCILERIQTPDYDAPVRAMTDDELDEMVDFYARTTYSPNTTPLYAI